MKRTGRSMVLIDMHPHSAWHSYKEANDMARELFKQGVKDVTVRKLNHKYTNGYLFN